MRLASRSSVAFAVALLSACGGPDAGAPAPPASVPGATAPAAPAAPAPAPTPPDAPLAAGHLRTRGAQLVDANGEVVRLTGLSWSGMESASLAPHGLWARSMGDILDQVKALGYNTLRVPYSNELLERGSAPTGIDLAKNPELAGLDGLGVLDALVAGARARGLRVVLDRHWPDPERRSGLWYTAAVPEQRWIDDWTMLAARYRGDPTVIGFDLHNEPHGEATWGDGNVATDWRLAAQRAGNAILAVHPDLLVIVEGIEHAGGDAYWWGGNLAAAGSAPVVLSVPDRLVYSAHDYPASVYPQRWFAAPGYPANLAAVWDAHWGYLVKGGIAPVWIGEFGTRYETASDQLWLESLARYIAENGLSFAFWALNPNSRDTGGILQDDWLTVDERKQAVLRPLLAPMLPPVPATTSGAPRAASTSRTAPSRPRSSGGTRRSRRGRGTAPASPARTAAGGPASAVVLRARRGR